MNRRKWLGAAISAVTICSAMGFAAPTVRAQDITQADKDKAIALLEKSKAEVLDAVKGLSGAQWNFKAGPDRWSIADLQVEAPPDAEGAILVRFEGAGVIEGGMSFGVSRSSSRLPGGSPRRSPGSGSPSSVSGRPTTAGAAAWPARDFSASPTSKGPSTRRRSPATASRWRSCPPAMVRSTSSSPGSGRARFAT